MMSDAEITALLGEATTVHVATINADGSPHLVPMFFVVEGGRIVFWTYHRSRKAVNLRRDPRIVCVVESGDRTETVRAAQINGRAVLTTDTDFIRRVADALRHKYGVADDEQARQRLDIAIRKRVVVTVVPERVVSWDHRKLKELDKKNGDS